MHHDNRVICNVGSLALPKRDSASPKSQSPQLDPICLTVAARAREGERGRVARAQTRARSGSGVAASPARRRPTGGAQRRAAIKPSVLRRVGRMVWVSPRHAALALATGLVCGVLVSRIGGMISPPYAAILGTLVGYPALVAVWRRLLRPGRRGR